VWTAALNAHKRRERYLHICAQQADFAKRLCMFAQLLLQERLTVPRRSALTYK
jgi:hypothetical protein